MAERFGVSADAVKHYLPNVLAHNYLIQLLLLLFIHTMSSMHTMVYACHSSYRKHVFYPLELCLWGKCVYFHNRRIYETVHRRQYYCCEINSNSDIGNYQTFCKCLITYSCFCITKLNCRVLYSRSSSLILHYCSYLVKRFLVHFSSRYKSCWGVAVAECVHNIV